MVRNLKKFKTVLIIGIFLLIALFVITLISTRHPPEESLFRLEKINIHPKVIRNAPVTLTPESTSKFQNKQLIRSDVVKIVVVICGGPENNSVHKHGITDALTLIKSVIISAKFYHVRQVDFHIFVDSDLLKHFANGKISEFISKIGNDVDIHPYFYNVFETLPDEFMKFGMGCSYIRIFLPEVLSSVDEILYLDNNVLVTGNIGEIWHSLPPPNGLKLVALAPNSEPKDTDIPYVFPNGVNADVMYMNLFKQRKDEWTKKLLQVYQRLMEMETDVSVNFQRLLNLALHDNSEILEILPCQQNFQYHHCQKEILCNDAKDDPVGIQILNGLGNDTETRTLIFEAYKQFDLEKKDGILENLLKPLKQHYINAKNRSSCDGDLGILLFKDLIILNSA